MSRYGAWPAHSEESESHKQLMFWSARNMLWNLKADPRFSYRVEVPLPDGKQEKLGLAVVLHGTGGACEGLMGDIKPWADKHRLAVMAPLQVSDGEICRGCTGRREDQAQREGYLSE